MRVTVPSPDVALSSVGGEGGRSAQPGPDTSFTSWAAAAASNSSKGRASFSGGAVRWRQRRAMVALLPATITLLLCSDQLISSCEKDAQNRFNGSQCSVKQWEAPSAQMGGWAAALAGIP